MRAPESDAQKRKRLMREARESIRRGAVAVCTGEAIILSPAWYRRYRALEGRSR